MPFHFLHSLLLKIHLVFIKILIRLQGNKRSKANILLKIIRFNKKVFKELDYSIPLKFIEHNQKVIFNLDGVNMLYSGFHRRHLKIFHNHDHNEALIFSNLFSNKKKITVIDLGANEGEISIFFAKKNPLNIVYSVECSGQNIDILKQNIELNEITNIKIFKKAISNKNNEALDVNFRANQTTTSGRSTFSHVLSQQETVESITLSSFIKQQEIKDIDFLKIDIENSNHLVGNCIIKNKDKIKYIFWELGFASPEEYKNIILTLKDDFKFYVISNNKFLEINIDELILKIEKEVNEKTDGFECLLSNIKKNYSI
jgi:FkbM family methyltransferase|tara:strand:+ start:74 stop:1015 length:942 start_codon:yes stop_codon:yes gene_type:complete